MKVDGMEMAQLHRRLEAEMYDFPDFDVILRSRGIVIIMFLEIQPYFHTKDDLFE